MKYSFETIRYEKNLPARVLMQDKPGFRSRTKLHWHKEIELLYMIDGSLIMTRNGRKTVINTDDVVVVNSEEIHIVDVDDNDRVNRYLVVQMSYDYLKNFYKKLDTVFFDIDKHPEAKQEIKNAMRNLAELSDSEDEFVPLLQNVEIHKLYYYLAKFCMQQKRVGINKPSNANFRYAKVVIEYIGDNYKDEISLNDMAALVGLSPAYFSKYFKSVTETSFVTYLNTVRLEHALKDLVTGNISVMDAALENGFPNVKSFISMCKKVYGATPTQCKKIYIATD
ncbi:MAG: AraC family transcriptional regulator [Ruminococcus sp.]|nr:AraC family transcriptional regulator [Ruminococcus sp.]